MYAKLKQSIFDFSSKKSRAGIVVVLTGLTLVAIFSLLALSVDTGRIMLEETRLQNAVDAAALAAVQEINHAVYTAGQGDVLDQLDASSPAIAAARSIARDVGAANGVYIDPDLDVKFGKRANDPVAGEWPIEWGVTPYNVVRVQARRTDSDESRPDGKIPLAFGGLAKIDSVGLQASATAFIKARDLVLVLDFSASMNDDSSLKSSLGLAHAEAALDAMWDTLSSIDPPEWPGTTRRKFRTKLGGIDAYDKAPLDSSLTTDEIFAALNLDATKQGQLKWPFPQSGRNADGTPKIWPSEYTDTHSAALWKRYINYVKYLDGYYNHRFCFRTLMDYLQEERHFRAYSEDLWRTPHYPFHAIKEGASLLLDFLQDLRFGDEIGLVSYGRWAVQEVEHRDGQGPDIDISADPITKDYATLDYIQRRHQAGDYDGQTGMGDGILKARQLMEAHARDGAIPTLIIMTDGLANQAPNGWSLPVGFNWDEWTDFDDDGSADFETTDVKKQYAFWEALQAIQAGMTVHTMAVGNKADTALMQAMAFAGGGVYMHVPGGTDIPTMQAGLLSAFRKIAAEVPRASLVYAP